MFFQIINHLLAPIGTYVRGTIIVSGFYMKPEDENNTFIANITQVDPAGW